MIVFFSVRAVDVIVLVNMNWSNFMVAEAMFELPWIFGFAAIALYGCSIVSMMAQVDRKNLFSWVHRPRLIYFICYGYLAIIFIIAMTLAVISGKYADETTNYLTLFVTSKNPLDKFLAFQGFIDNQNIYMELTLAHYVIWAAHCFFVLIFVLTFVLLFLTHMKKNISDLNAKHSHAHKLDPRLQTFLFKVSVLTLTS